VKIACGKNELPTHNDLVFLLSGYQL